MSRGAVLVENFFSRIMFPGHTVAADEEAGGHEAFRIANGRRSAFDYYESITTNAQRIIKITADRQRMANGFALDRGHNLAGKQILLECSDDDFGTIQVVFDITVPTVIGTGTLDGALGSRTEEGAWLIRFSTRSATYWRLRIPAMGTGLKPKIVGAWLGTWYGFTPDFPVAPDADELVIEETMSDLAWRGTGIAARPRTDALHIQLTSLFEYELARYHLHEQFGRRRPMWIVHDDASAEQALLAIRPSGTAGFQRSTQWYYHRADIAYQEHEPLP